MKPLQIAMAASALLVVVVVADLFMNREFFLEAEVDGEWEPIGTTAETERGYVPGSEQVLEIDPNGTHRFRVRVANDVAWGYSEEYTVRLDGRTIDEGTLRAPARSDGSAEFTVEGAYFQRALPILEAPAKDAPRPVRQGFASFFVTIGYEEIYGGIQLREASP
ncbi:MAG: hypothetical protein ACT4PT_08735 [Methanobacteriota archaeon]